jgi:hypothetical protein
MTGIPDPGRASKAVELVVAAATGSPFDVLRQVRDDGSEFWSARDLMTPLGYTRWENFFGAVERAKLAALNSNMPAQNHFREAAKMVELGDGAQRSLLDVHLSRYGAYLVAMNGDPHKTEIAAAQHYFAVRTREAEVIEQRATALALAPEDRAIKRLAVLQAAKGLIDERHLEAKARLQLAIGLGEAPELDSTIRPLYAHTYMEEKGLTRRQIRTVAGMFGKRLKAAFVDAHGVPPKQYPLETGAGQIRNVNAYTEGDRALFDAVWDRFYAQVAI